jgi:hypothetical protein
VVGRRHFSKIKDNFMRIDVGHNNQAKVTPRRSVYDHAGTERIGDVQECDGGFIARGRQGDVIGTFDSLDGAARACWCVAHHQPINVVEAQ